MTITYLLLALTACKNDQKLNRNLGENIGAEDFATVAVDPPSVDYGDLSSGEVEERTITVTNVGTDMSVLTLTDIELAIGEKAGFVILDAPGEQELRKDESVTFTVAFSPLAPEEGTGQVIVHTNDEVNPRVPVPLRGVGLLPQLSVSPDPLIYNPTMVGCPLEQEFVLHNTGNDTLTVTAIASEGMGFEILERPILPLTLAPDLKVSVRMTFVPSYGGVFSGALAVESNDPRGIVRAVQEGTAAEAGAQLDSYLVPSAGKLDILFAVDQSNSMAPNQALLAEQASALATTLQAVTDDVQVGVVTGDDGCLVDGVMSPRDADFPTRFTTAVQQGDETSAGYHYTEALIYLAWKAVVEEGDDFGCNAGFPRDDALLHVIPVTDEAYDVDGFVSRSWWSMLDDLRLHQQADYLVKFSAVAKPTYAGAYGDVVDETHGTMLDIMGPWSSNVDTVAASDITMDTFPVSAPPNLDTMRVYVDRVLQGTASWVYRADVHAVVIPTGVESGHTVEIDYATPVDCTTTPE